MKVRTHLLAIFAIALTSAAIPAAADGDSSDSLKDLTAQWWQWALSIPVPSNPLLDPTSPGDPTAVNCMVGQRGPIWFLAGAASGGVIRRTCSVPEGVPLFFPVINAVNVNTPGFCGQTASLTVKGLRALVAPFIDAVTVVEAKVDNKPVKQIRRVRSEPFIAALPTDNLFAAPCAALDPPGQPAGIYSPGVDDGYYVKLNGLDEGVHTVEFSAKSGAFELDVAYILTVIRVSKEVRH